MIQHFLITVLVIYGVHASTRSGMILGYFGDLYDNPFKSKCNCYTGVVCRCPETSRSYKWYKIKKKVYKMVFNCTPCMASIYGTISFFMFCDFPSPLFLSYGVWVFSLCGFNYILNKILNR
jgi:hypothetical protein